MRLHEQGGKRRSRSTGQPHVHLHKPGRDLSSSCSGCRGPEDQGRTQAGPRGAAGMMSYVGRRPLDEPLTAPVIEDTGIWGLGNSLCDLCKEFLRRSELSKNAVFSETTEQAEVEGTGEHALALLHSATQTCTPGSLGSKAVQQGLLRSPHSNQPDKATRAPSVSPTDAPTLPVVHHGLPRGCHFLGGCAVRTTPAPLGRLTSPRPAWTVPLGH